MAVKHYTAVDRPPRTPLDGFDKSRTRQSEAKACDVNVIMARFEKTGVLPVVNRQAFFADVSELGDYRSVVHNIRAAEDYFMSLPASVRARVDNDPAQFLDWVSNPDSRDELIQLGLLEADADPVTNEPPTAAAAAEPPPPPSSS